MKKHYLVALSVAVIMTLWITNAFASVATGQGRFSVAASSFPNAIEKGKAYQVSLKLTPKESANQAPFEYVCKLEVKMPWPLGWDGWVTVAKFKRSTPGPWTTPVTFSAAFKLPAYHVGGVSFRWVIDGKPFANVFLNPIKDQYATATANISVR